MSHVTSETRGSQCLSLLSNYYQTQEDWTGLLNPSSMHVITHLNVLATSKLCMITWAEDVETDMHYQSSNFDQKEYLAH